MDETSLIVCGTPGLDFDSIEHRYSLRGRPLAGVTSVLKWAGRYEGEEFYTDFARERGRAVHAATHYADDDDLGEFDPRIRPYIDAYRLWKRETGFESIYREIALAHTFHRYAGTMDILGFISGELALIDIKTGQWQPAYDLQLGAYAELAEANGIGKPDRAFTLLLKKDGRYAIAPMKQTLYHAREAFIADLRKYRKEHGI
jgi:hypothetical protein